MGSLYSSQHELLPLFKKGKAPHVNNVELGRKGRWRSNVWTYPGASSLGSDARARLQHHPTLKPVALLEDALLDPTNRADVVLDPFLGAGSTLIAAEQTGRQCCSVELDPLYVDLVLRRYESVTGQVALLVSTGESFTELALRRDTGSSQRLSDSEDAASSGPAAHLAGPARLSSVRDQLAGRRESHAQAPQGAGLRPERDRDRQARILRWCPAKAPACRPPRARPWGQQPGPELASVGPALECGRCSD